MLLAEGWEMKNSKELPWNYTEINNVKGSFCINGVNGFSEENKNNLDKIQRILLWGKHLMIDTGHDFYFTCWNLPDKLVNRIKKNDEIDVMIKNTYNEYIEHYKYKFNAKYI